MNRTFFIISLMASFFCLLALTARDGRAATVSSHNLTVTASIRARTIRAVDRMVVGGSGELRLLIRREARITRIVYGGRRVKHSIKEVHGRPVKEIVIEIPEGRPKILSISFHETFPSVKKASEKIIKRGVAYVEDGVMGPKGVFLPSSSYWYPQEEEGLSNYNLMVNMPRHYVTVSEGDWLLSRHSADRNFDRWKTTRPVDGLDLVASRFGVRKEVHRGIKVYTFFLKRNPELERLYLEKTKAHLDRFIDLIGDYPYKKFAVVESFLPTGYGMPSFTLLGSKVLRLAFIPDTSLGHEIAHSWWGNSVYVDESGGNWAEAVTTYTADYLFEREKGPEAARLFRFRKLEGFKNFAGPNSPSLRDFTDATNPASRAVGYDKGVMLFIMLEDEIGREAVEEGLRAFYAENAFKKATWRDMERAFERSSGKDLSWFFDQWLERKGGPEIKLESASVEEGFEDYDVTFTISQKAPAYRLKLPVRFTSGDWRKTVTADLDSGRKEFTIGLEKRPLSVEIDPDYRVFRILDPGEVPPSISAILGDSDAVVVVPSEKKARLKYEAAAKLLAKDFNLKIITDSDPSAERFPGGRSAFIFGGPGENRLFERIRENLPEGFVVEKTGYTVKGKRFGGKTRAIALAIRNPVQPDKYIALFTGTGRGILERVKRLRYFAKNSYVVFRGREIVLKGAFPGEKVLSIRLDKEEEGPSEPLGSEPEMEELEGPAGKGAGGRNE